MTRQIPFSRRAFIGGLSGAAVAASLGSTARPEGLAYIGLLSGVAETDEQLSAVRRGLGERGYIEGRNLALKHRWADGKFERLSAIATQLVADGVGLILASAPPAALAAKAATATIPIVFMIGSDPVQLGLVASFNRPGGNVTGVHFPVTTLAAKRLNLLRQLVPTVTSVGFLANPANPAAISQTKDATSAAAALGVDLVVINASSEREIDASFGTFTERKIEALFVSADSFFLSRREQVVALAARARLPAIYHLREMVVAGGLMSYGPDLLEAFRLAGQYAGRILQGERPGDLPVQQSTKFELIINLKTARTFNLEIPATLAAIADEVIE
ncbi:MAG: ABC transporter substrate-binding protein [Xanthobacteraceae bacterium]